MFTYSVDCCTTYVEQNGLRECIISVRNSCDPTSSRQKSTDNLRKKLVSISREKLRHLLFLFQVSVAVSVVLSLSVHAVICLLILGCCPAGMLAPILAVLQQAHVELALLLGLLESTMAFGKLCEGTSTNWRYHSLPVFVIVQTTTWQPSSWYVSIELFRFLEHCQWIHWIQWILQKQWCKTRIHFKHDCCHTWLHSKMISTLAFNWRDPWIETFLTAIFLSSTTYCGKSYKWLIFQYSILW